MGGISIAATDGRREFSNGQFVALKDAQYIILQYTEHGKPT